MKIIDLYNIHSFNLKGRHNGTLKTICVFCSHTRRKHPKEECCFVNIDKEYYFCHHCGATGKLHSYKQDEAERGSKFIRKKEYSLPKQPDISGDLIMPKSIIEHFSARGISESTIKKAKIEFYAGVYFPSAKEKLPAIAFPYYKQGLLINYKFRSRNKDFTLVKDAELCLWNIDSTIDSEDIVIQEGEYDVLSSIECGIYNAVSVPNGAKGRIEYWLDDDIYDEYFENKKRIILAGDNDTPGRELQEKLAARLGKHRCYIVDWKDCKDGNEYLLMYGKDKYKERIDNADPYPINGIFVLDDKCFEDIGYEWSNGTVKGSTTHIRSLDPHFTWLKGDTISLSAYSNVGKSEFMYFLSTLKAKKSGWRFIMASFEEKGHKRFYEKLIEIYIGKKIDPRHRAYNNQMTKAELMEGRDFVKEHFKFIYPPEKFTREKTLELMSNCIAKYGGDVVVIDPVNRLTKDITKLRDDEYLIEYYNEQAIFAKNHNVCAVTVTHINKPQKIVNGLPVEPTMFDLLGGQATNQAIDDMLILFNSSIEEDRLNERSLKVAKVRDRDLVGIPGTIALEFDYKRRRFKDGGEDPFVGYDVELQSFSEPLKRKFIDDNEPMF
jgi:twinkle protein